MRRGVLHMCFVADQRDQVSADTAPGAFAKAVIRTIEAVGTRPTNANWQRKHSAANWQRKHSAANWQRGLPAA